ncbi:replication-relaxation family protein [Nocardiopsis halophila]|uniref:replication-relaxation family protein n=1 Tax=Nocardiopsis halophila TaxID=141692 RepID=UPI00037D59A2|nr:replication-relaxation family protein [Nocardiopsis halophila]
MASRSRSASTDPSFRLTPLQRSALLALSHHRLALTSQLQRMLRSATSTQQYLRKSLAGLRDAGLADRVHRPRGGDSVWFATAAGTDLAQQHGGVQERPYRMDLKRAQGPLQHHTLDVVEAGLCFLEHARSNGIVMTPWAWTPEVAHRIRDGQRPRRSFNETHIISDAVIDVVLPQKHQNGTWHFHAFLEIDRGTESVQRLASKVTAYERYYRYRPGADHKDLKKLRTTTRALPELAWSERYTWFPALLVILAGQSEKNLRSRIEQLQVRTTPVPVSFDHNSFRAGVTTLEELRTHGPGAEIFKPLGAGWRKRGRFNARLVDEPAPEPAPGPKPDPVEERKATQAAMQHTITEQDRELAELRKEKDLAEALLAAAHEDNAELHRKLQTQQREAENRALAEHAPYARKRLFRKRR